MQISLWFAPDPDQKSIGIHCAAKSGKPHKNPDETRFEPLHPGFLD
jgi:hypothetical protein